MKLWFSTGPSATFKPADRLWIQLYWPELKFWTNDMVVRFDSALRIRTVRDDYAFGFCVLGFGFGFSYQAPTLL